MRIGWRCGCDAAEAVSRICRAVAKARARRLREPVDIRAHFVLLRGEEVLQAPPGTAFRSDDGWAAFLLVDGRVVRAPIAAAHRGGDGVGILRGLESGAKVLLQPGERLRDQVRVRLVDTR